MRGFDTKMLAFICVWRLFFIDGRFGIASWYRYCIRHRLEITHTQASKFSFCRQVFFNMKPYIILIQLTWFFFSFSRVTKTIHRTSPLTDWFLLLHHDIDQHSRALSQYLTDLIWRTPSLYFLDLCKWRQFLGDIEMGCIVVDVSNLLLGRLINCN